MLEVGWYVVMSNPQREEAAEAALERLGYTVLLPRYHCRLVGIRIASDGRRVRTRGPGAVVAKPLFPSYLFVLRRLPEQRERPMLTAPGVARILRHRPDGDGYAAPKLLAGAIVDEIRTNCDAGLFDKASPTAGKRLDLRAGDQVRTAQGAVAELVDLDEAGRAEVLMTWFGHKRLTRVRDARALELADG